jgi:hypothetical protein
MVFRAESREVVSPLDRFEVRAVEPSGRELAIFTPSTGEFSARLERLSFPQGDRLPVLLGLEAERAWKERADSAGSDAVRARFDFDGDGTEDSVVTWTPYQPVPSQPGMKTFGPDHGVVRVVSGRDHRVLFEDCDSLEYEGWDRAIPLGDVDADGCAELALLHPRMDRSKYDLELFDLCLGAKSWVTVVSGALATR